MTPETRPVTPVTLFIENEIYLYMGYGGIWGIWGMGYVWGLGYGSWGNGHVVRGMGYGKWEMGYGVWGMGSTTYTAHGSGCRKRGLEGRTEKCGVWDTGA